MFNLSSFKVNSIQFVRIFRQINFKRNTVNIYVKYKKYNLINVRGEFIAIN